MKLQKRLNMIIVILIVILISLISFGGVYYQSKNQMINRVPDYTLGADLNGYRTVKLSLKNDEDKIGYSESEENTTSNETNTSSETADETTDETENTTNETTSTPKTDDEKREDYKKAAKIIKGRLKSLNVENYTVTCDESTGEINVTLPEYDQTDIILSDIVETGIFAIKDSETEETLLDNSDVRNVVISENNYGTTKQRVMTINLTTKGTEKYKKITEEYQNKTNEATANDTTNETSDENNDAITAETTTGENETNETSDSSSTESKQKQVALYIDSSKMLTTDFSEIIDNGKITLTLNNSSSTSTDEETDKENKYNADNLAAIIENDPLPVDYQIDGNTYIASDYTLNDMKILICIEIILAGVISTILIIKYRKNGVLQAFISIGYIALLLITIRYANVKLSMEGLIAIGICYIMNSIFSFMIASKLNKQKDLTKKELTRITRKTISKYSLITIPVFIVTIICTFVNWTSIYSLGMILFWGILISLLYNWLIAEFLNR